ncbi:MAG: SDR family NAD(P)-dependent oxidoreductase [Halioglobus sp.]
MIISTRRYQADGQNQFASLTGDYNPMHIDPITARREMLGDVVVHGMHAVMQALEDFASYMGWTEPQSLYRLKVSFANAIYLDKNCELAVLESDNNSAKLKLTGEYGSNLMTLQVRWNTFEGNQKDCSTSLPKPLSSPRNLSLADTDGMEGELQREIQPELLQAMFPKVASVLGISLVTELAALTRLVGMVCPGLQSIFSGFELNAPTEPPADFDEIRYAVSKADARISRIAIETQSRAYSGSVECFYRPRPEQQLSFQAAQSLVDPEECKDQVAWIIGGTRGIGEVTAKTICAAGGRSIITYYQGRDDAERLAQEMNEGGGDAVTMQFDHADPSAGIALLKERGVVPNAIYYFASPKIFVQKGAQYEHELFGQFCAAYLEGISGVYRECREAFGAIPMVIFHPSSSAIDQPVKGLVEYSAAKAAAEIMLEHLQKFDKSLKVIESRLPRIATDQTMTLMPFPAEKAETVMLPLIRRVSTAIAELQE